MCERDVGLFLLIQQVIANIPWALQEHRVPIVYFQSRTCYWTPNGYEGRDTVWEYYFEPVIPTYPASSIPEQLRKLLILTRPALLKSAISLARMPCPLISAIIRSWR